MPILKVQLPRPSGVASAIDAIRVPLDFWIAVKSTVPVGYTVRLSNSRDDENIIFSPEFLWEGGRSTATCPLAHRGGHSP